MGFNAMIPASDLLEDRHSTLTGLAMKRAFARAESPYSYCVGAE
jgi:hypothetical protein